MLELVFVAAALALLFSIVRGVRYVYWLTDELVLRAQTTLKPPPGNKLRRGRKHLMWTITLSVLSLVLVLAYFALITLGAQWPAYLMAAKAVLGVCSAVVVALSLMLLTLLPRNITSTIEAQRRVRTRADKDRENLHDAVNDLENAERVLRDLTAHRNVGLFGWDGDGIWTMVQGGAIAELGHTVDDYLGKEAKPFFASWGEAPRYEAVSKNRESLLYTTEIGDDAYEVIAWPGPEPGSGYAFMLDVGRHVEAWRRAEIEMIETRRDAGKAAAKRLRDRLDPSHTSNSTPKL